MFSSQWRNHYPEASVLWGKRVHQRDTLILASNRIWLMSPHCNDIINSFYPPFFFFIKMSDGCENFLLIYYIWNINLIFTVLKQNCFLVRRIMFASWFVIMPMLSQIPKFEVKKNQQWAWRKHCGFGGSVGHCNRISDRGTVRPAAFD